MFEVTSHRQPIKDNTPDIVDDSPKSTNETPDPLPEVPAPYKPDDQKDDEKDKEIEEEKKDESENKKEDDTDNNGGEEKEEKKDGTEKYQRMNNFVRYAIREHLGHDFDSMSEETEQELYDLFCDMEIISPH